MTCIINAVLDATRAWCKFAQNSHKAELAHHKNVLSVVHRDATPSCLSCKSDVSLKGLHRLARRFAMWRDTGNRQLQFSIVTD